MPLPQSKLNGYTANAVADCTDVAWYTLYTKPHAEMQVDTALQARGLETYLPTVPVWRARRRQVESEPLFACYTFVRADLHVIGLSGLSWTPGLRNVVMCDGAPARIPDRVMAYIRTRTDALGVEPRRRFQTGERVRITQGPMKDMEGVFTGQLSGIERAQVLVSLVGRLVRCDVNEDWLEQA